MVIAIIQCIGVFFASLFGTVIITRANAKNDIGGGTFILFAIGVAMISCGIFFNGV